MNPGEETGSSGAAGRRPIVYCLVPRELAPKLHDFLRRHFRDDPAVEVVVERRRGERRQASERRGASERGQSESAAGQRTEGRQIRNRAGRRAGGRRAALVPVDPPAGLPRRARRHTGELVFVERLEPSTQELEDLDTARLVIAFQAGDRGSFTSIYGRYYDRVYGYLRLLLKNHHDAEDLTQQVFMQAFEALPRYERRGQPFRAWLMTVVRNLAIDNLRRSGRIQFEEAEQLDRRRERDGVALDTAEVLGWVSDRELLVLLERLSLAQRQVLLLRYMLDLTSAEAARVLGRTPEDVRILQHRALRFIEERFTALGRRPSPRERARMSTCKRHAPVLRTRRFALM